MPPAITSDIEDESEAGDIPYTAPKKKLADGKQLATDLNEAAANGAEDDDDDEGGGEDEYIVEKVISHAFEKKGVLKYEVAWVGWDEHTWEPEENLDNCPDELDAYFKSIGGKPQFKAKEKLAKEKPTPVSSAKKRKLADDSPSATPEASTPATDGRGRKRKQTANDTPAADANGSEKNAKLDENDEGNFPAGSWEHEVKSIDTLERGEDGKLWAFILWNDGRHTKHFSETLKRKCPLKMIDFYEAHLQFNPPAPRKAPNDINDIIDETDVKPVASILDAEMS